MPEQPVTPAHVLDGSDGWALLAMSVRTAPGQARTVRHDTDPRLRPPRDRPAR
ncbi:hypothetical protein [Propionibacterium ruminifibrarum]|uniref:hypothetical protein n=1 Tax=Propionibacterium ruminifibrarum TaxID=1962131 RepID=UPI0015FF1B97|nr:hypothetical protein [Propionibacterium ruminifibrarum]